MQDSFEDKSKLLELKKFKEKSFSLNFFFDLLTLDEINSVLKLKND